MIPEDIRSKIVEWSVGEIYDKWDKFALEASIFIHDVAIRMAREESDARIKQIHEFTRPHEAKKDHEDPLIYVSKAEDWR